MKLLRDFKLKTAFAAAFLTSLCMSGCTMPTFNVESLYSAPKMTEEQTLIHDALTQSAGQPFSIVYPNSGEYRSAYIVKNIDSEATDEAIVFYRYSNSDSDVGIKMNILDRQSSGSWTSVVEVDGEGTAVDTVVIAPMGDKNAIYLMVGYQTMGQEDNVLVIYKYSGGKLSRIGSENYSILETLDIDANGNNDLVTVQKIEDSAGKRSPYACLLQIQNGEIIKSGLTSCLADVSNYVSCKVGKIDNNKEALYIDSVNSNGEYQTEIIYYRYSALQNPTAAFPQRLLAQSTRSVSFVCADVENDGVIEIPFAEPMLGYEMIEESEQVFMTTWFEYKDFYMLEKKYSGYYSPSDGYFLSFLSRWGAQVTVKEDTSVDQTVLYKYNGNINSEDMTELARFACITKDNLENFEEVGYQQVCRSGQIYYMVKIPKDSDETLIPTFDEIKNNFYAIN